MKKKNKKTKISKREQASISKEKFIYLIKRKCFDLGGQAKLAEAVALSRQQISAVVNGIRKPSAEILSFMGYTEVQRYSKVKDAK